MKSCDDGYPSCRQAEATGKFCTSKCAATQSNEEKIVMTNTQSPAPGVAAEVGEILPILEQLVVALASQDEEGLIEHAEPMIAARRLIGKLKEPAPAGRWIAFKDRMPPEDGALDNSDVKVVRRVLVTNNLSARDRMGRMSHIWLAMPLESSDGTIVAFTEADTKIHGLTHWLDPMPSLASRTPAPGMACPCCAGIGAWRDNEGDSDDYCHHCNGTGKHPANEPVTAEAVGQIEHDAGVLWLNTNPLRLPVGTKLYLKSIAAPAPRMAGGVGADPMDTPLPCDVVVGHVTMRKGVALRALVARTQTLYDMARPTGGNASIETMRLGGRFEPRLSPEAQALSDQLDRAAAPHPAPAQQAAGADDKTFRRLQGHASLIVANICAHSEAGKGMTGWLDDACTSAEILEKELKSLASTAGRARS